MNRLLAWGFRQVNKEKRSRGIMSEKEDDTMWEMDAVYANKHNGRQMKIIENYITDTGRIQYVGAYLPIPENYPEKKWVNTYDLKHWVRVHPNAPAWGTYTWMEEIFGTPLPHDAKNVEVLRAKKTEQGLEIVVKFFEEPEPDEYTLYEGTLTIKKKEEE